MKTGINKESLTIAAISFILSGVTIGALNIVTSLKVIIK